MSHRRGKIIIEAGANVWPHELETAHVLADNGYVVRFVSKNYQPRMTSPDIMIDGILWELKSPTASNIRSIQRLLHKALRQAPNVIVDTRRVKHLPDHAIEYELRALSRKMESLDRLWMIDHHRRIIDINGPA